MSGNKDTVEKKRNNTLCVGYLVGSRNTSSVFDKSTSELEIAMAILRRKDELRNIKYLRKTKFTYV